MSPTLKAREVIRFLEKDGWTRKPTSGSHTKWAKAGHHSFILDSHNKGDNVAPATVERIVKEIGEANVPETWLPGSSKKTSPRSSREPRTPPRPSEEASSALDEAVVAPAVGKRKGKETPSSSPGGKEKGGKTRASAGGKKKRSR